MRKVRNIGSPNTEFNFPKGYRVGDHDEYEILSERPISSKVKNTFAEVYLVEKTKTKKLYAFKFLKASIIMEFKRAVYDFQDEIKFLMELEHKNIIKIEDYGSVEDADGLKSLYLATEYIAEGGITEKTGNFRKNVRFIIDS